MVASHKTFHLTYIDLCSKFYICFVLAPYHWMDMGLVDIYYPVIAFVDFVLIHVHLLIEQMQYHPIDPLITVVQKKQVFPFLTLIQHLLNGRDVSSDIPQLLTENDPKLLFAFMSFL